MSRGAPLARSGQPAGRPIIARALPPAPMSMPVVVMPAPPLPMVYAPPPPPPVPTPSNETALDAPAIGGLVALAAVTWFVFLREPERPPPEPDPLLSSCPSCNPLLVMGIPNPTPSCDHVNPQPKPIEEPDESAPTSAIIILARHR